MSERVESEGFYEMVWDCDHCGTKGLLGKSQRHCAQCGAPQNPDKRYFPTPEQQTKVAGHSYEGSDRYCPACKAPMGAKANNCAQCGSPLDGAREVRGVEAPIVTKRRRRIWPWVVAAIVLLVFAIWWFFIRTSSAQMTVVAHRWESTIPIEQFGDHPQSAWHDQMPAGAQAPVCHRKQRTTKQIEDGEECHTERHDKKDGTFEQLKKCKTKYRSEPVLDDWCDFTIRSWFKVDEAKMSGTGLTVVWATAGVPTLMPREMQPGDLTPNLGTRRQGARSQKLTIEFANSTCDVDAATWRKYADGQKVKLEVRARSGDVVCSSL
ncbi:MAG: uncharacterized protein JWO36_1279 [Myxococcales bacterium]|nr:uncharacterized protein [Myxococcales bacterium]